jgi:hypothetical protein
MNKKEIIDHLVTSHRSFTDYIEFLTKEEFMFSRNNKWTAGQQLEHLILAVRPITQGFMLPMFVFKMLFGKANRPSKTYDELVLKYKMKLEAGGVATSRFTPRIVSSSERPVLIKKLNALVDKLTRQVNTISEKDLDQFILPHPLLGKLTLREMMYFTVYHVEHHRENIRKALAEHQVSQEK